MFCLFYVKNHMLHVNNDDSAAKEGAVTWRRGFISFVNGTDQGGKEWGAKAMEEWKRERLDEKVSGRLGLRVRGQVGQGKIVFGVLSDGLVARPGGVFLGLVKERERDIRPSFLGQTDFVGFSLDFASQTKSLRLWRVPPLARRSPGQLIELTDLRRFGDPVLHYAAQAHQVLSNGRAVEVGGKKVYVIFDTGTTGLTVTRDLYESVQRDYQENLMRGIAERGRLRRAEIARSSSPQGPGKSADVVSDPRGDKEAAARAPAARRPWRSVHVSFISPTGDEVNLKARDPIVTPVDLPWARFDDHLLVLGLSFLQGNVMTVDFDTQRLALDSPAQEPSPKTSPPDPIQNPRPRGRAEGA
eukprot:Tamp_05619.p1 GENE.Tamp_05619~~Tamp_05619.p1  ORF type:complete len:357 (-),score=52.09 Tamp_05619:1797-2867(-)